jgi:hypothetical protein
MTAGTNPIINAMTVQPRRNGIGCRDAVDVAAPEFGK